MQRYEADGLTQPSDLVVTMDDAPVEHTSMFFCAQEGTGSSFHGIGQTVARYGLFASSHCASRSTARGQSTCYQTGQFYLLPTGLAENGKRSG